MGPTASFTDSFQWSRQLSISSLESVSSILIAGRALLMLCALPSERNVDMMGLPQTRELVLSGTAGSVLFRFEAMGKTRNKL